MAQTLAEKKDLLLEELSFIPDPYERLSHVVDLGKNYRSIDESLKIDAFLIEGCVSQLWIVPQYKEGNCYFQIDADSVITKGIAALISDFYSGYPPEQIVTIDPSFLGEVGITQHLSSNRRNGLTQIWKRIESFARGCMAEEK